MTMEEMGDEFDHHQAVGFWNPVVPHQPFPNGKPFRNSREILTSASGAEADEGDFIWLTPEQSDRIRQRLVAVFGASGESRSSLRIRPWLNYRSTGVVPQRREFGVRWADWLYAEQYRRSYDQRLGLMQAVWEERQRRLKDRLEHDIKLVRPNRLVRRLSWIFRRRNRDFKVSAIQFTIRACQAGLMQGPALDILKQLTRFR